MSKFRVGDKVFHVGYGMGKVLSIDPTIFNGDDALVVFLDDLYQPLTFTLDGRRSMTHKVPQLLTLEEARAKGYDVPKQKVKKARTGWVNVYPQVTGGMYMSKEQADVNASGNRIDCVQITFEYEVDV